METAPGYSDLDACPLIFLYRHSLELYLKAVIILGLDLAMRCPDPVVLDARVLAKHTLVPLGREALVVFGMVGWNSAEHVPGFGSLDGLGEFLAQLDRVDSESMAFRYPTNKTHRALLPSSFLFNVSNMACRFDALLECLDGAISGLADLANADPT